MDPKFDWQIFVVKVSIVVIAVFVVLAYFNGWG
jgi:hypothetical protein